MSLCHCWQEEDPCCGLGGYCESDATDVNATWGWCKCCGAEMFKENNCWFHHSQEEIPFDERVTIHYGI